VGASLPHNLQMGLGESVSLELDTDRPYSYHAAHVKQYPPGKVKKAKTRKKKIRKIKIQTGVMVVRPIAAGSGMALLDSFSSSYLIR